MGMKILFLGGYRDGDEPVYSSAHYHQGMPLKMRTDHTVTLCLANIVDNDDGYLGLALNFAGSTSDKKSDLYNGKAAYLAGCNKVKLDASFEDDTSDTYPYLSTLTFDEGQELYVNTDGVLSNVNPGGTKVTAGNRAVAGVAEVGSVVSAITTYLVVNMLPS